MKKRDIYIAIRDVAKDSLPELAVVDIQKQQMKRQADDYPMPLPSLLIEIGSVPFSNIGNRSQIGSVNVVLYLYLELVTDTYDGCELEDETLQILDIADDVFEAFHCTRLANVGMMTRKQELPNEYGMRWICLKSAYEITIKDNKDDDRTMIVSPKIKINTQIGG